jgi:hypothetical protein
MTFPLQFEAERIPYWAQRYDVDGDTKALEAGSRIAWGQYRPDDLRTIFRWKTGGRGISRLDGNSDPEIAEALAFATSAKTDRAAVAVLLGLRGVAVPVASAILTAIKPSRYAVIDFRALESLGCKSLDRTIDFYLRYLRFCRSLGEQQNVDLRTLDRALWQWSEENGTSVDVA